MTDVDGVLLLQRDKCSFELFYVLPGILNVAKVSVHKRVFVWGYRIFIFDVHFDLCLINMNGPI